MQVYTQTPEDVNRYIAAGNKENFAESLAAQQNMKLGKYTFPYSITFLLFHVVFEIAYYLYEMSLYHVAHPIKYYLT